MGEIIGPQPDMPVESEPAFDLESLREKPEGFEVLDQVYSVSDEKNLEGTIKSAAEDAVANDAIRLVRFHDENEEKEYYVSPLSATKILTEEEVAAAKGKES